MPQSSEMPRRLPDGSLDINFYRARAESLRHQAIHQLFDLLVAEALRPYRRTSPSLGSTPHGPRKNA